MESPFEISSEAFDRALAAFDEITTKNPDDYLLGDYDDEWEDDGQPTEWEEWQDVHGGDDGFEQWEVDY